MGETRMEYLRCPDCGTAAIGSIRACRRCGYPFTDEEIAMARKDAGKCPGCGFEPCKCEKVKEALEKNPESRLILIEEWEK